MKKPKTPRLAAAAVSASAKLTAPHPPNKPLPPPRRYTNPPSVYGSGTTKLDSLRCEQILKPVSDHLSVSKVECRFSFILYSVFGAAAHFDERRANKTNKKFFHFTSTVSSGFQSPNHSSAPLFMCSSQSQRVITTKLLMRISSESLV